MKILVTGANGQLGRCLQDRLALRTQQGEGPEYCALARSNLDIADHDAVQQAVAAYQPDVIINAAAYTAVDKAEQEPQLARHINADGPANLAKACAQNDALLIHVSTDYVFDGRASEPYSTDAPTNPLGVYGASKLEGERRIQALCPSHVIVRTAWVFSEYGNNFLKTMLRLGAERDRLRVVADQNGTPTYAGDLADALVRIAQSAKQSRSFGIYHYCGGKTTSWYRFAKEILEQAHQVGLIKRSPRLEAISTEQFPTLAQRPAYSVLSGDKLVADYGIAEGDWLRGVVHVLECSALNT